MKLKIFYEINNLIEETSHYINELYINTRSLERSIATNPTLQIGKNIKNRISQIGWKPKAAVAASLAAPLLPGSDMLPGSQTINSLPGYSHVNSLRNSIKPAVNLAYNGYTWWPIIRAAGSVASVPLTNIARKI